MSSVNKAILVGYLGRDPEVRYTPSGTAVANFTVATTENWTNKEGQKESHTEWHRIVAWGRLGEICGEYLSKGKLVYIEGRIKTNEWEDQEGNKRQTKEIVATNMTMLGPRGTVEPISKETAVEPISEETSAPVPEPAVKEPTEDDIPF